MAILRKKSTKVQFIVDDEPRETNCDDDDDDYDDKAYNSGDSDDDSYHEDSDDDASSDGHSDNDDGADPICAICDDGGKLLSCKGQCKRAFHPTKKHGEKSECETLGYTSAQRKRIVTFICKNCKYKQHQCFKCGELEPSDGPHAKVFQCNNTSCGYFYHPECIAQLLDPCSVDGAFALEKKISFTCPIHWCFKCKRTEDRTQDALQLAACRRCPRSYHRQCLPRKISFGTKDQGATTYAWELPQIKFFYCPDHIDKATKAVRRDHIKFPPIPEIHRKRDPAKKRVKMTGKGKSSTDQHSISASYVLDSDTEKRATSTAKKETTSETPYDVSLKGAVSSTRIMFDHSVQSGLKDASGQSKNHKHAFPPSFPFLRCFDRQKEVKEKTGMHGDLCVEQNKNCVYQQQDIMLENPLMNKDAEWDNENCIMSNTREELVHDMRGNSYRSPLLSNAQEMPTNPSPEQRTMDYCDSYPIASYQCNRYEQRFHVNCSCFDYFTCRKYMPLLDDYGNLKYGGLHAIKADPVSHCSLQDNSDTAFEACTYVRVGGSSV